MKRIETQWLSFRALITPDAGPVQISETRTAFYAGATAMFRELFKVSAEGVSREPTTADLKKIDELYQELQAFKEQLRAAALRERNEYQ